MEQRGCLEFTNTSDLWDLAIINWKLLSTVSQEISFKENDIIIEMGKQNDYLFYVKKGYAQVKVSFSTIFLNIFSFRIFIIFLRNPIITHFFVLGLNCKY